MIGNVLKKITAQNPSVATKLPKVFKMKRPTENKAWHARKTMTLKSQKYKENGFILWHLVFILQFYTERNKMIEFLISNTVYLYTVLSYFNSSYVKFWK